MFETSIHDLSHHSRLPSCSGAEFDVVLVGYTLRPIDDAFGGTAVRCERHAPRRSTPGARRQRRPAARRASAPWTRRLASPSKPRADGGCSRQPRPTSRGGCDGAAATAQIERFYTGRELAPVRFSRRALSVTTCVAGGQVAAPSAAARRRRHWRWPGGGAVGGGRRRARREHAPVVGRAAGALGASARARGHGEATPSGHRAGLFAATRLTSMSTSESGRARPLGRWRRRRARRAVRRAQMRVTKDRIGWHVDFHYETSECMIWRQQV